MTLTFVPGEVNSSPYSLAQCVWKNHHIVAYGSGNNLIISTSNLEGNLNNVQTIYLDNDPVAVDINELNAWICISLKSDIYLYKLINEYLSKPKWEHALVIPGKMQAAEVLAGDEVNLSGGINCLQWAVSDNELLVALNTSLTLYHIYDEYGELKFYKRWCSKQPNPVMHVKITRNASKIVSRGEYDKIIKVWTRCSYGDTTSLFLMSYLDHPIGEFVTDFKWKQIHDEEMKKGTSMDSSMATIKNFGGLGFGLLDNDNDNDVLYTVTNKNILRIWASDTITGHNRIRKVKEISLDEDDGDGGFSNLVIVDNYNLSPLKDLANKMNSAAVSTTSGIFQNLYTALKSSNGLEIALVISQSGRVKIYSVVVQTNSVLVNRLDKVPIFFNENCFPVDTATNRFDLTHSKNCTVPNIESKEYVRRLHPINITEINKIGSRNISILIQDRIKSTIRVCYLSYERLLYPTSLNPTSGSTFIGSTLINKFSGHTKTIRKLRKSSASRFNSNILISILDFPENNYIWEPLKLRSGSRTTMTLTKRFQIDVLKGYYDSGEHSKHGIWDAVILNDIEELSVSARHHLVATIEKTGNISLWDCNGLTMDDKAAELIARQRLEDNEGHYIYKCPRIFLSMEVTTPKQKQYKQRSWCIIAVFEKDLIRSWKVTTSEGGKGTSIVPIDVKSLPLEGDIQQIEVMDLILNPSTPSLFSVIDSEGKLRTFSMNKSTLEWIETCFLHTNVKNASKIHGVSLIHKVAIVNESGTKLSIWDTKNGVLEYEETFENEKIRDLDWTFIDFNKHERSTLSNAILLVGFLRHQLLYTQLRYDYTNNIPSFAVLKKVDISDYTSHEIGDLIWLSNAYSVIACGNQFFIDDRWVTLGNSNGGYIDLTIRQLMVGYIGNPHKDSSSRRRSVTDGNSHNGAVHEVIVELEISNLVRILNGPLPAYHPQFLIQSLFLNKVGFVKDILIRLLKVLRFEDNVKWDLEMNLSKEFMESDGEISTRDSGVVSGVHTPRDHKHKMLFNGHSNDSDNAKIGSLETFFEFNKQAADLLIQKLTKISLPLITRHQQITLISVMSCILEIDKYSDSLDSNGIRFLIGFKLFQMSNKQTKLSMRDINWALHSDNEELIINIIEEYYKMRLKWKNVKETGMSYWVEDHSKFVSIIEKSARNEFGDSRDPSGLVSLFYLALNKKNVLVGLWKSVVHPEQQKMLKFLANDFTEKRWRTASLKNAFVLLSKHRYMDAAYFFLLADSIKDCCSVIANKLQDMDLCIAVAKVYEYSKKNIGFSSTSISTSSPSSALQDDSILPHVLETWILPVALQKGDRWTTSWIFWELKLREISVRALIESPIHVVKKHRDVFSKSCIKNNIDEVTLESKSKLFLKDDPVLMILFNNLRRKNVNLFKGALELSQQEEYNFVVKSCLIYTRMGCDYLALSVLRNWEFIQPTILNQKQLDSETIWNVDSNKDEESNSMTTRSEFSIAASAMTPPSILGKKSIPSVLVDGSDTSHNKFGTDSTVKSLKAQPPPPVAFEEPDMSSFDFGF